MLKLTYQEMGMITELLNQVPIKGVDQMTAVVTLNSKLVCEMNAIDFKQKKVEGAADEKKQNK